MKQRDPGPSNAYNLSFELLYHKLNRPTPDFGGRLREKLSAFQPLSGPDSNKILRVLSLCSGAARIEIEFIRHLDHSKKLELTLLDINSSLLETAQSHLSRHCVLNTMVGDVNRLNLGGQQFDIILCVSGLHHVVELEHVTAEIAKGLSDKGEFWSIGEYIGRNGNRLWPEAYDIANSFFMGLPESIVFVGTPARSRLSIADAQL